MRGDRHWIQTYTGRQFWPLDPHPDDVCIEDIAHALAGQCRFGGHCEPFYSVAQHSVDCLFHCDDLSLLPAVLMHDAAEAYWIDFPRPLKVALADVLRPIEQRLEAVICERFGIAYPWPDNVHEIDNRQLATEKRDLMVGCDFPWEGLPEPYPDVITPISPRASEIVFLNAFDRLCGLGVLKQ